MHTTLAPARLDTALGQTPPRQPLRSRHTFGGVRVYSAGILTLGAAIIHLAVVPAHFREWLPFGLFFLGTGSAQIVLAFELLMLHGTEGQVSLNGEPKELHLDARPGETVRLRLINAVVAGMDGGPEAPLLIGVPFQVVSLDGRDLNAPEQLESSRIPLGMGQRADLVFSMPASGSVRLIDTEVAGQTTPVQAVFAKLAGNDNGPRLASAVIGSGDPPALPSSTPLFDPLAYGAAASDLVASATPDVTAPVILGEHPAIRDGRPELVHTINNQSAPDVPPIEVTQGQIVRLHIVNTTAEYHPMHLHGHLMSVITRNSVAPEGSPIHLDSILVGPNETWDVQFAADNPGIWMFHCHVLLHAGMGMMTTINYTGYSTPFEMGTRSGNMPE